MCYIKQGIAAPCIPSGALKRRKDKERERERERERAVSVVTNLVTTKYWSIFLAIVLNESIEQDDEALIVKDARGKRDNKNNDSNDSDEG